MRQLAMTQPLGPSLIVGPYPDWKLPSSPLPMQALLHQEQPHKQLQAILQEQRPPTLAHLNQDSQHKLQQATNLCKTQEDSTFSYPQFHQQEEPHQEHPQLHQQDHCPQESQQDSHQEHPQQQHHLLQEHPQQLLHLQLRWLTNMPLHLASPKLSNRHGGNRGPNNAATCS